MCKLSIKDHFEIKAKLKETVIQINALNSLKSQLKCMVLKASIHTIFVFSLSFPLNICP